MANRETVRDDPQARKGDYLSPTRPARRRQRTLLVTAAASILFALAAGLSMLQPTAGRADPAIDCIEQDFLNIINQYRAQNGLQPLALNTQLSAAADWMSGDLGANDYFGHTDSLGRSPGQRARDYGYTGGVGENIAGGVPLSTAQAVFNAWKDSPGHNENMLGSSYRVIGIGRVSVAGSPYGVYWTTDFGQTANGPGDPAPTISCGSTPGPTATPQPTPAPTNTPTPPTPTEPATVMGDVNCDLEVGSTDALEVLRLVAVLGEQPECQATADVDCDGRVTSVDALDILRYVVSQPAQPGPGCPPIGSPG